MPYHIYFPILLLVDIWIVSSFGILRLYWYGYLNIFILVHICSISTCYKPRIFGSLVNMCSPLVNNVQRVFKSDFTKVQYYEFTLLPIDMVWIWVPTQISCRIMISRVGTGARWEETESWSRFHPFCSHDTEFPWDLVV